MTLHFVLGILFSLVALALCVAATAVAAVGGGPVAAVLIGPLYAGIGVNCVWRFATGRD